MNYKILFIVIVIGFVAACGPNSNQQRDMVRCSERLYLMMTEYQLAIVDESNVSASVASNALSSAIFKWGVCPASGMRFNINPDQRKWLINSNEPPDVAAFCSEPHYRGWGQTRYSAIGFNRKLIRLTNSPSWTGTNWVVK